MYAILYKNCSIKQIIFNKYTTNLKTTMKKDQQCLDNFTFIRTRCLTFTIIENNLSTYKSQ